MREISSIFEYYVEKKGYWMKIIIKKCKKIASLKSADDADLKCFTRFMKEMGLLNENNYNRHIR